MNGFVEERLSKIQKSSPVGYGCLLVCGVFFALIAAVILAVAFFPTDSEGELNIAIPLLTGLGFLAAGIACISLSRRRQKKHRASKSNPYVYLQTIGFEMPQTELGVSSIAALFNEEYAKGDVIYESAMHCLTRHYIYTQNNLAAVIGNLQQILWIYWEEQHIAYQNKRTINYTFELIYPKKPEEKKPRSITLTMTDRNESDRVAQALAQLGLSPSTDKRIFNLAASDYDAFLEQVQLYRKNDAK